MFKRNKDGVVMEYSKEEKKYVPRKATKNYFEESKHRSKMSANSRRINRK